MARLWPRKRLNVTRISSSRQRVSTNNDGDHVESSLELEEIVQGIGNTVETLPWDIALSSSEDGNIESSIVADGHTGFCAVQDVDQRNGKARLAEDESSLETKLCQWMDVLEQGLPHCVAVLNDNATEGIFPVEAEKYRGVQSIGSLHSM